VYCFSKQIHLLMNKVNQILAKNTVVASTTVNDNDININNDSDINDDSLLLATVPDVDIIVKGRNVPKELKPQAYCHPAIAKAHKGVSPQKEKRKNKNKIRKNK
jgi:hypothetical protein